MIGCGSWMVYCSKCGVQVDETMTFCPRCGAPIKDIKLEPFTEQRRERWERRRDEKAEKGEKQETQEKGEKQEKGEFRFIGPFIGGLILIFIGAVSYLQSIGYMVWEFAGAVFTIAIGLIVVIAALALMARKRNLPT
jgi:uncharacterized Zn finger protein (UPF0148 family)